MVRSRICSSCPSRRRVLRISGPRARSKGRCASSIANRLGSRFPAQAPAGPRAPPLVAPYGQARDDHLYRLPVHDCKGSTQDFMAAHNLVNTLYQGRKIEGTMETEGREQYYRPDSRLPTGPRTRVAVGQRRVAGPQSRGMAWSGGAAVCAAPVTVRRKARIAALRAVNSASKAGVNTPVGAEVRSRSPSAHSRTSSWRRCAKNSAVLTTLAPHVPLL